MAKQFTWPLGVFARQQLTLRGTTPENWKALARAARGGGDLADAAEFAGKAGDQALLDEIAAGALAGGDLFAYQTVCRVRESAPAPEALLKLAQAAQKNGHETYAQRARQLLPQSHGGEA